MVIANIYTEDVLQNVFLDPRYSTNVCIEVINSKKDNAKRFFFKKPRQSITKTVKS